jgi:hypothetical protein
MEHFLANVCSTEWNLQQDAGRTFAEACAALKLEHPSHAKMIDAWFERFDEMMAGPIAGTVDILAELREQEVPIYALSNWSAETFPFCTGKIRVPALVSCNLSLWRGAPNQTRPTNLSTLLRKICSDPGANSLRR